MDINTPFITDASQRRILEDSMEGRLNYSLMNDFLSKYSLQNDLYALKGLVSALMRVDLDSITAIDILNPIQPSSVVNDKNCVLDIRLELNHSKLINIEIQSRFQDFWAERSITYLCRSFNQLHSGESYYNIKPCVQIAILSHDLFKKDDPRYTDQFYSEYRLLNTETHTEYSSKFELRMLSLSQLENASEADKRDPNGLYYWARLFRAASWEELKMIAQDNPRMESFIGTVRQLTAEEEVAQACEARRRYSNDLATYEQEIAMKQALIDEKNVELSEKDAALSEKDAEINALRRELERLKHV